MSPYNTWKFYVLDYLDVNSVTEFLTLMEVNDIERAVNDYINIQSWRNVYQIHNDEEAENIGESIVRFLRVVSL